MIDGWLPQTPWSDEITSAAFAYRQGHLLLWDSIVYGADFDSALLQPTIDTGGSGSGYVKIADVGRYVMITSQTCDICEEGRASPKFPWVSVAPVYNILPFLKNRGQAKQIRTKGFGYLVALTAEQFQEQDSLWVVDLRLEFPLEKSVLATRRPIEAFTSEGDYSFLSDRLASRRNRAALDDRIRTLLVKPLGEALVDGAIDAELIDEIRVQSGPIDRAKVARLHVLVRDGSDVEHLEDQFSAWEERTRLKLPDDLELLVSSVLPYSEFRYSTARNTSPIDYSDISE